MYVDPYSQQVISTDLVSQRLKRKKVRDAFAYLPALLVFPPRRGILASDGAGPVSYTHLTLPTTPYV